jgi:uracil-DNA glycosylase
VGLDEEAFRSSVFIAAVCRCFPGKAPSAGGKAKGDRVPAPSEITACESWMRAELALLDPDLLLPVGRLAIGRFLPGAPLEAQVGRVHRVVVAGRERDVLPLPHPSGVSRWFRTEPGQSRLGEALALLAAHPAWSEAVAARQARETPR